MSLRTSKTALAVSAGSLALACAFGESSPPGPPSLGMGGSGGGATAPAGNAGMPAATTGHGGAAAGTGSVTAGTGFGNAGTGFGTAGTATAGTGGDGNSAGNTSGGAAGTSHGGAGGSGSAGTGSAGTGVVTPTECPAAQGAELPLPLTVSGNFIPSGYFAGPAANTAGIVRAACEARPAGHTIGDCSKFTFRASVLEGNGAYAGVFWQHGANNWGTGPGLKLAAGATKVTFKAWSASASGGELVEFSVGGIGGAGTLCADQVNLGPDKRTKVTLTKTPTAYTIDLQGQTYPKGVIGGFVWSAAVSSVNQVLAFYVDEIQWLE